MKEESQMLAARVYGYKQPLVLEEPLKPVSVSRSKRIIEARYSLTNLYRLPTYAMIQSLKDVAIFIQHSSPTI